jgi:hypothetical protein
LVCCIDKKKKELNFFETLIAFKGITSIENIPGKLSAYLFEFNPNLFELLQSNSIIDKKIVLNLKKLKK